MSSEANSASRCCLMCFVTKQFVLHLDTYLLSPWYQPKNLPEKSTALLMNAMAAVQHYMNLTISGKTISEDLHNFIFYSLQCLDGGPIVRQSKEIICPVFEKYWTSKVGTVMFSRHHQQHGHLSLLDRMYKPGSNNNRRSKDVHTHDTHGCCVP